MGNAKAQVAQPAELPVMMHDNDNDKVAAKKYGQARKKERDLGHVRSGLADARFAYGRRKAIFRLMEMRCGGPCTTDDAELLAELFVPFVIEAALLHKEKDGSRRCPEAEAFRYLRGALPVWTEEHPETLKRLVSEALARRADAVAVHDPRRSKHVQWLPTMPELVAALRPTREEARHLRGWSCIDPASPEEHREADRLRKRAERVRKGATPRQESISARKPWEAMGISRAKWYRLRQQDQTETRETVSSAPCSYTYGTDEFVSPAQPHVPAPPVGDDWQADFAYLSEMVGLFPEDLAYLQEEFPGLDILGILPALDAEIAAMPDIEPPEADAILLELLKHRHDGLAVAA